jgi:Ser/Thr protein kinase RdoA (MazF antagonist)
VTHAAPPGSAAGQPYAALTPDRVLDAVEAIGLRGDGRLLALNSFENRVYQIALEGGGSVVAKFYRPARWSDAQIGEEHLLVRELALAEIPVAVPLARSEVDLTAEGDETLHAHGGFRFAVYRRRGGRAPELEQRSTLEWIGRFLARIHAVGAARPFTERPPLDIATFGEEPSEFLLAGDFLPADLVQPYRSVVEMALTGVRSAFARAGEVTMLRLHGDCHAGNILWTDDGPHFVDFDDARTGPAVQDLWMLLAGERAEMERQLGALLTGYERFRDFDRRELHLVEALRTLRLIHYAAWIARRWSDPAFPAAFPFFNTQRYWQDRVLELREQVALMQEPPLEAIPS